MSRKLAILLGVATLVVALITISFLWARHERQLVESWRSGSWDTNLSWLANQERRRERLRSIAPVATKILRRHLNYDPVVGRWRDKTPSWLPSPVEEEIGRNAISAEAIHAGAARDLAMLGPAARDALPDLIRQATHSNTLAYTLAGWQIALAIGSIGENSTEARAALDSLATNRHRQIAASAAFALWQLAPNDPAAQKRLESFLNQGAFHCLAWPLSEMGEKAKALAPAVGRAFDQIESVQVKINVARALWRMTGDAEAPLSLIKSFQHDYESADSQTLDRGARSRAVQRLSSAALVFEDIPECRAALRPLFEKFRASENRAERSSGEFGLEEFRKVESEQRRPK